MAYVPNYQSGLRRGLQRSKQATKKRDEVIKEVKAKVREEFKIAQQRHQMAEIRRVETRFNDCEAFEQSMRMWGAMSALAQLFVPLGLKEPKMPPMPVRRTPFSCPHCVELINRSKKCTSDEH